MGLAPDGLIEAGGAAAGDGDGGPLVAGEDAGDEDDLAHVVAAVGERPLHREWHGEDFAADRHVAGEVVDGEGGERLEQRLPARLPIGEKLGPTGERVDELAIAVPSGLLAIGGEEVGPAGEQVARDMLHDDGDAVRIGIERDPQLVVGQLGDCLVGPAFVRAKTADRPVEEGAADVGGVGGGGHAVARWGEMDDVRTL